MSSESMFHLNVQHENQARSIVVYAGMPMQELQDTLISTFSLNSSDVVGVTNSMGAVFPLSLVSKAPSYFAKGLFQLVTTASASVMMVDDNPPAPQAAYNFDPPSTSSSSSSSTGSSNRRRSVSTIFSLDDIDIDQLRDAFVEMAPAGVLTRDAFVSCFGTLLRGQTGEDAERARMILERMFTIFDSNDDGVVDAAEFLSGLSVLVGGDQHAKIRAAFDMYDYNKDGYISLHEFERYLVSVFTVLREQNKSVFEKENTTPEELASATAQQCFEEADLNKDGNLSFEEFRDWYTQHRGSGYRQSAAVFVS